MDQAKTEHDGATRHGHRAPRKEQIQQQDPEIEALRGKSLFNKNVRDLCLVSNVKIPPKFK
ncbi:hypothetical protein A2U01_0072035, partial [Trifolium medium]|nr:hypothetical protein [Trifolium medium]